MFALIWKSFIYWEINYIQLYYVNLHKTCDLQSYGRKERDINLHFLLHILMKLATFAYLAINYVESDKV